MRRANDDERADHERDLRKHDDVFKIGDKVAFHEDGMPGTMIGTIKDIDMGYAIVTGPDGRVRLRSFRELEEVTRRTAKVYKIIR